MVHVENILQETDPKKILFYLEYMEMVMEMLEKRNKKHDLKDEYQKVLNHYKEVTDNK